MNGHDDLDRTLARWFETDAQAPAPADRLQPILDATRDRRPRPSWLAGFGSQWVGEARTAGLGVGVRSFPRTSAALLLLVALLAALLGGAVLVGARLSAPAPAAEPGDLAYALDGDIFLADWDGTDPVRIADGLPGGRSGCGSAGYWAEGSMWSPDGRHLAYRSPQSQVDCARPEADTYPTVLLTDPTGHPVAEFPGVGWLVAWSPDSTRVATWLDLYPSTAIGVDGTDGVRQALLSLPRGKAPGADYDPAWSPDGRSFIVRLADYDEQTEVWTGGSEMWELPLDGGTPRPVPTDDPRSHRDATWSADGTLVTWADIPESAGIMARTSWSLMVAEAGGSRAREVMSMPWSDGVAAGDPLMSPAGDHVVFRAGDTPDEFRVVDLVTGLDRPLAHAGVLGGPRDGLRAIEFSPAGDRVLFAVRGPDAGDSLWSVGVDGSDPRLLVLGTTEGGWRPQASDS